MVREARDKDRALAQGTLGATAMEIDDATVEEAAAGSGYWETQAAKLIILHVGSQNLRIGLGTDALPKTVPMVIARKRDQNESEEGSGEPRPRRLTVDDNVPPEPEKRFREDVSRLHVAMGPSC